MKVYIHFEDPTSPEYTKRFTLKDTTTPASKVVAEFVDCYNTEHGAGSMSYETVSLSTSEGKVICLDEPLNVKDKSDLYISVSSVSSEKVSKSSITPKETKSNNKGAAEEAPVVKPKEHKKKQTTTDSSTSSSAATKLILDKAKKFESSGHYKEARLALEQVVNNEKENFEAHLGLGRLAAKNENHKLASKHFGIAVNVGKKNSSSKLSEKVVEAMLGEGRAHTLLGNFRNAATCYQPLVSLPGKSGVDGKIGMSKLLLETGHAQEAANMVMTALEPPHQEHVEGLLLYATIAERHEKNEEALSVLLRLVVTNKDFSPVKKLIAKVFAKEGMITLLQSIVPLNAASASAYAFLATVSKDHGAVDAACELLLLAHQTVPSNHSYALNYVHALELQGDMSVAWNALLRHLSVNTHLTIGGVSNASFLAAAADGRSDSEWNISWVSSAAEPYAECATTGFSGPTSKQSLLLNDELLDVLALWFAGVKIRYLMGASVVSLIACIEAARLTSSKPLHNTTIRNEHAYYCCVAQLKAAHCLTQSSIVVPSSGDDVVYVCGDSHSLSPAWQKFTSSEEKEVTLSPKLVTGLKHWHLRPEGDFYPKIHFERVVKSIPDGAKVVFIFGEIDCREGILFAVQKDRYETVEEGMRCTLAFYITELERLAATRRFTVLVHPIVPVLDETRSLVVTYNSLLRSAVLKSKSLRWLGGDEDTLFNGLLTEDGKLATSFVLDGTHLHPSYISLLAPAITNALQR